MEEVDVNLEKENQQIVELSEGKEGCTMNPNEFSTP